MRLFSIAILLLCLAAPVKGQQLSTFFTQANAFLKAQTMDGQVNYKNIKSNFEVIQGLYNQIGGMDLSQANDVQKKAFYINAYNLIVIYQVSKYYPLKSALDQSGFFNKVRHKVAGQSLTLDALEIIKLIRPYKDPRVHFALACAAKGCPPLLNGAFMPATLEQQLTQRTTSAINNTSFIKVDKTNKLVVLNEIFKWYKDDFEQQSQSVLAYINNYRQEAIPASYSLSYYEYDWSLNSQLP